MSDTIQSAEKLSIEIWLQCVKGQSILGEDFNQKKAIELIEADRAAIRADEARKQAERFAWISVKDRLPKDSHHVLCCHGKSPCFVGYLWAGEWHDLDMGMRDPTHWMPLPEPPDSPADLEATK
jgi:hypothetical protein